MSRSYTKMCIGGNTTADTEKKDKRLCNRIMRSHNNQIIKEAFQIDNMDSIIFNNKHETYNIWCMDKDGKRIYATRDDVSAALDSIKDNIPYDKYSRIDFILKIYYKLYGHKTKKEIKKIRKESIITTILHYINRK